MNSIGYIYKTTNKITGEFYIGKRLYHKDKHIIDDTYLGSSIVLKENIKKYGIENFCKEILCECDTLEELSETENTIIAIWINNKLCINKTNGIGYGGIYKYGKCKLCNKETALWKDKICMSCIVDKPQKKYCNICKKNTYIYPNSKCRSCVTKKSLVKKYCSFCQRETTYQGRSCREHRVILQKRNDGTIRMCKVKTFGNVDNKVLINDISIFDDIKILLRGKSKEIALPKNKIFVKSGNEFVSLNGIVINEDIKNWYEIYYKAINGKIVKIEVTGDHPLPIKDKGVLNANKIKKGDFLFYSDKNKFLEIVDIKRNNKNKKSYDITTDNNYFNINKKVLSHNCRSFLSPYKEGNKYKWYGRFNLGVVSLNLPYIAYESKGNINDFWSLLDKYARLAFNAQMSRVNNLKKATSDVAPILWQNGALARLSKGEPIEKLFYNGKATISLG